MINYANCESHNSKKKNALKTVDDFGDVLKITLMCYIVSTDAVYKKFYKELTFNVSRTKYIDI